MAININSKGKDGVTYDAIVVGSGMSGGISAKELCEKGLKTLVLERGRDVKHPDYPTATLNSWDMPHKGRMTKEELKPFSVQNRTGYTLSQATKHWWVKDDEHPYIEEQRFDWIRGYHVGGRSLLWGRQCYRWSEIDFTANLKDGHGVDWPIRYKDIAPWYDYVEKFVGIAGRPEGLPQLPDGVFQPAMPLNCIEEAARERIAAHYSDRILTNGRNANLTEPLEGRGKCQYRARCIRGCPYGAYYSSNAGALPAAYKTGNLTLRPFSVVESVIYDPETGKATGVRVIDTETLEAKEFFAKVVFLNASCIASTQILLNSKSERFPDGMGNDSDTLGRYLMDHHFRCGAHGVVEGFEDKYVKGRRPTGFYIPRFRNISPETTMKDFVRGYGYQGGGGRWSSWGDIVGEMSYGQVDKEELFAPGQWGMGMQGFGETLPYKDNTITLDKEQKDKWGMPLVRINCVYRENEEKMRKDMVEQAKEILEVAGVKNVNGYESESPMGHAIHEMGTARMGRDPKTSVLNKWNQIHAVPNVYVTDGACMTSSACQNPSITYMALSARAADHAVGELKKMNL